MSSGRTFEEDKGGGGGGGEEEGENRNLDNVFPKGGGLSVDEEARGRGEE